MSAWVDLHLHSCRSDGAETPERLVERAAAAGATAIALTDHDTVAGVADAQQAATKAGMGFLTGVEISAAFDGREIHVVGLGLDAHNDALQKLLGELARMRRERMRAIHKRLRTLGIPADETRGKEEGNGLGRMHVAVALRDMGKADTVQGAFERYLNRGRPAYVPKELPNIKLAVEAIHTARGLAFIAHPGLGHWIMKRLDALLALPFDGLEAWHPSHTHAVTRQIMAVAESRRLLLSGGSDCHGNVKNEGLLLGRIKTPAEYYHHILDALL